MKKVLAIFAIVALASQQWL